MEKRTRDLTDIMSEVTHVKKLAQNHGLEASYIPVVGAIEIIDGKTPIGITFNGRIIKNYRDRKYYSIKLFFNAFKFSQLVINKFAY